MEKYQNFSGNSPIIGYEIGDTYIIVLFKGMKSYRYSYGKAGRDHVNQMIELAREGAGLSAYITKNVRFLYD